MSYILENNLKHAKTAMQYTEEIIKSARAKDQDKVSIFSKEVTELYTSRSEITK